jgi:hypothetical protein
MLKAAGYPEAAVPMAPVILDPFDETRQLGFWLLTADDQERLAMQLLASTPAVVADEEVVPRRQ